MVVYKTHRLSNENPSPRYGGPSFKLLVRGDREILKPTSAVSVALHDLFKLEGKTDPIAESNIHFRYRPWKNQSIVTPTYNAHKLQ